MRRARPLAAAAVTTAAALAALSGLTGAANASTHGSAMVAFGDSVASGYRCGCIPFPTQYANRVGDTDNRVVSMTNYAYPGATAGGVERQLRSADVQATIRQSSTALVMIGANDFESAFDDVLAGHRESATAFPPVASYVQRIVTTEIQQIQELHPGIHVIVGDYWNVMEDGRVGLRNYGSWGESKAVEATLDCDIGLHNAAVATHSTYVSTYEPFKGWNGKSDPTRLLVSDGDHPNATGHDVIANAFFRAAPRG